MSENKDSKESKESREPPSLEKNQITPVDTKEVMDQVKEETGSGEIRPKEIEDKLFLSVAPWGQSDDEIETIAELYIPDNWKGKTIVNQDELEALIKLDIAPTVFDEVMDEHWKRAYHDIAEDYMILKTSKKGHARQQIKEIIKSFLGSLSDDEEPKGGSFADKIPYFGD